MVYVSSCIIVQFKAKWQETCPVLLSLTDWYSRSVQGGRDAASECESSSFMFIALNPGKMTLDIEMQHKMSLSPTVCLSLSLPEACR